MLQRWITLGSFVGCVGVLGLGTGCTSGPDGTPAPWAGDAPTHTPAPQTLAPSGVVYYPQAPDDAALAERVAYSASPFTKLPADYLYPRLQRAAQSDSPDADPVNQAFARLAAGSTDAHADLIAALELEFVHRADTSSLDLLGLELSTRFRDFAWEHGDYPGGPEGPNEAYAGTLADALDGVTPERRANRTAVSVIIRDEATDAVWQYMLDQWTPVPGEDEKQLNRHAVPAYLAMRDAAAADGIDLTILSGHRDPKRAAANAARVGNSFAVASFSSHSLGLAIDVELTRPQGDAVPATSYESSFSDGANDPALAESPDRFRLTTRPMSAVVDMRRSPVHKWLHLHAHKFGWYPFQHEPWHWEYNPPGFRDVFFADFPDGPPRNAASP